jgi:4'-phosphopantetheinyl transferase
MIAWLVQSACDLPALPAAAWLSPPERERLSSFKVAKRRDDWLLGRWTAKRLVQTVLARAGQQLDLAEIGVVAAPDGAPELQIGPEPSALSPQPSLSISHVAGRASCALGPAGMTVGADIERAAPHHPAFPGDYFTPEELAIVAAAPAALRDTLVTAIWSAKEALLKALRLGLTVDTRRVVCLPYMGDLAQARSGWAPLMISAPTFNLDAPYAWWRLDGDDVLTLAVVGD